MRYQLVGIKTLVIVVSFVLGSVFGTSFSTLVKDLSATVKLSLIIRISLALDKPEVLK